MLWLLLSTLMFHPGHVSAADWVYPISRYQDRQSFKGFGQYFDKQWYQGKEVQFPVQFTGFHSGLDLEIFPEEKTTVVPVFAVSSGRIVFAGPVTGYGGVVLLRPETDSATFLYGHLQSVGIKVGQTVNAGDILGNLGAAFSPQTGGERKHLHFAVYRGADNYFRGYEQTKSAVENKFLDPQLFLSSHVSSQIAPTPVPTTMLTTQTSDNLIPVVSSDNSRLSIWTRLLNWLKNLF